MLTFRTLALVTTLAACGGAKYPAGARPTAPAAPAMPRGGIENAALPYQVLDTRTGRQVDEQVFWGRLSKARAVCIGEEHPNPHHHWAQLHSVREIAKRLVKGDKLGLGLEMVQRPFQGPLDDYVARKIDADTLQSRVGWAERWGYEWSYYAPTFDAAIAAGGTIIALNTPKELTKKIVRQGLESLTADEKAQVPELVLDDKTHRAWFDALMSDMGGAGGHSSKGDETKPDAPNPHDTKPEGGGNPHGGGVQMPSADRIYTAQVLWDETMADGSARWLKANPTGHLVILAGNGHCHDSAIVNRLKRRGIADVISVRAVIDDGESGNVADVLARPMNDYAFVMQMPKGVSRGPAPSTASN